MTAPAEARAPVDHASPEERGALVWIDAREAIVVRWAEGASSLARLASDVPAHRKSTRHVRHGPAMRGGSAIAPEPAVEPHRLEHLDRYIQEVAEQLAMDEDILVLGHGSVHEQLVTRLREIDSHSGRERQISVRRADRLTEPQLVAELRERLGTSARRCRVRG